MVRGRHRSSNDQMTDLMRARLADLGMLEREFAKLLDTSPQWVSKVLGGKGKRGDLDEWAAVIGIRFVVSAVLIESEET